MRMNLLVKSLILSGWSILEPPSLVALWHFNAFYGRIAHFWDPISIPPYPPCRSFWPPAIQMLRRCCNQCRLQVRRGRRDRRDQSSFHQCQVDRHPLGTLGMLIGPIGIQMDRIPIFLVDPGVYTAVMLEHFPRDSLAGEDFCMGPKVPKDCT